MHYTGLDIIEIARIEEAIKRWGERFLQRVYTEPELKLYRHRIPSLAARFAAKEAVIKALGVSNRGLYWKDIEILSAQTGQPMVNLYGTAKQRASQLGLHRLAVSLTHSRQYALATVTGGDAA